MKAAAEAIQAAIDKEARASMRLKEAAYKRYNEKYDNSVYMEATSSLDYLEVEAQALQRAIELQDAALYLCGHPDYTLSDYKRHNWTRQEKRFLRLYEDIVSYPDKQLSGTLRFHLLPAGYCIVLEDALYYKDKYSQGYEGYINGLPARVEYVCFSRGYGPHWQLAPVPEDYNVPSAYSLITEQGQAFIICALFALVFLALFFIAASANVPQLAFINQWLAAWLGL